jgi:hypothetical protein
MPLGEYPLVVYWFGLNLRTRLVTANADLTSDTGPKSDSRR